MLKNKIHIPSFSWTKFLFKISLIIFILVFLFSCKSVKETTNNQLDITSVKTEQLENKVNVSQLELKNKKIVIHTADHKKPTIITDSNGNTQKFENVKSITIEDKTEKKKDSVASNKKVVSEKVVDKSRIKESKESISDTAHYKDIFKYVFYILVIALIIYLLKKFKK